MSQQVFVFFSHGAPPVFPEWAVLTAPLASIFVPVWLTAAPQTSWLPAQAPAILSSCRQTHTITPMTALQVFEVQFAAVELQRQVNSRPRVLNEWKGANIPECSGRRVQHSSVSGGGPSLIAVTWEAHHGNRVVFFVFVFLAKVGNHFVSCYLLSFLKLL